MGGHHLILGEMIDFITGETLEDTHDERYRQKIARILVEKKGYSKGEIKVRNELLVKAGDNSAIVKIDFLIRLRGKVRMVIKYGPGSLVTRQRPALAASRLAEDYQIPVVVVTNGEDAEILEGSSGSVRSKGLGAIPSRAELLQATAETHFKAIGPDRAEMEARISYCYEVDDSCPCDDTVCRL
jgi:hypothetical protein